MGWTLDEAQRLAGVRKETAGAFFRKLKGVKLNTEPVTADKLTDFSGDELDAVSALLGIAKSGAKGQKVDRIVKETIDTASPGGGYIISSSNSIHPGVRPENYIAMIEAVHKYGYY